MRRTAQMVAMLAFAGCAGRLDRPVEFAARPAPATTTLADDGALAAAGYVSLGPIEVSIDKERCRDDRSCEAVTDPGYSEILLLKEAARRGGDVVRVARAAEPARVPWTQIRCAFMLVPIYGPPWRGSGAEAICAPVPTVVGTRSIAVSSGTVWRREPALVPNMQLEAAIEAGDGAQVHSLLARGTNPNVFLRHAPLTLAAEKGHQEILGALLAAGARAGRDAALLAAVERDDLPSAQALLRAGAHVDAERPVSGDRPLHLAAYRKGAAPMIRLLLQAGADVDGRNATLQTPLQFAVVSCDVEAANLLLGAGADRAVFADDPASLALARQRCPSELAEIERQLRPR